MGEGGRGGSADLVDGGGQVEGQPGPGNVARRRGGEEEGLQRPGGVRDGGGEGGGRDGRQEGLEERAEGRERRRRVLDLLPAGPAAGRPAGPQREAGAGRERGPGAPLPRVRRLQGCAWLVKKGAQE